MSSDGDASCGGVVRLEAGVDGAKDGSQLLVEPRLRLRDVRGRREGPAVLCCVQQRDESNRPRNAATASARVRAQARECVPGPYPLRRCLFGGETLQM